MSSWATPLRIILYVTKLLERIIKYLVSGVPVPVNVNFSNAPLAWGVAFSIVLLSIITVLTKGNQIRDGVRSICEISMLIDYCYSGGENSIALQGNSSKELWLKAGKGVSFRDEGCTGEPCPEMLVVPPGEFVMGSPNSEIEDLVAKHHNSHYLSEKQRRITINRPFAIGKYEVTFSEWDSCVNAGGCAFAPDHGYGRNKHPAINVSWDEAIAYTIWLSRQTRQRYRLPTEAEWEYAARAQSKSKYFFGSTDANLCGYANVIDLTFLSSSNQPNNSGVAPCADGYIYTAPVGSFKSNAWGLYDIIGNVWEWADDCWNQQSSGVVGVTHLPSSDKQCTARAIRGGSWNCYVDCQRLGHRNYADHETRKPTIGFRLMREIDASNTN